MEQTARSKSQLFWIADPAEHGMAAIDHTKLTEFASEPESLPVAIPDPEKIAVVLNANARRVTKSVVKRMWRLVGKEHVYFSHSLDEAGNFVREIVQQGYGTVVCGGGDGTLTNLINMLYKYIDESNDWRRRVYERTGEVQPLLSAPRIGALKLGTGNGLSGVLGTSNPVKNVARLLEGKVANTVTIPMIEADGEYFFFGGQGYDAVVLNDYNWVKDNFGSTPVIGPMLKTLAGYFAGAFLRTLPRAVRSGSSVEMRVYNTGKRCFYVDPRRGDRLMPIEQGELLYEGPLTMAGVATTPFFGYGLRAYPFAGISPDMMNLRLASIGPFHVLARLGSFWDGSFRDFRQVKDFLVESVRVECVRPFPYQHSGEGRGFKDVIEYKVSDRRVNFLDFYEERL